MPSMHLIFIRVKTSIYRGRIEKCPVMRATGCEMQFQKDDREER